MEEDGQDLPSSPFWLQSTTNLRRASSFFFNSGVFVILLVVTAVLFMVFIIPSVLSFTSQVFRPNLVQKSWDSINLVLVLFALAFGFLSRNRNEDRSSDGYNRTESNISNEAPRSNPSTPQQWCDFSDQTTFNNSTTVRRHRTSSSLSDLREISPWVNGGEPWRFTDDTQLDRYRVSGSNHPDRHLSWRELDKQDLETKDTTNVDALPPQPPAPPSDVQKKAKRTYQSLAQIEDKKSIKGESDLEPRKISTRETDPPASPPPTMPAIQESEQKSSRSDRKRRGSNSNAAKDFLTSFYNKNKKKRQRQKSIDNLDTLLHRSQPPPLRFQLPPPPPPEAALVPKPTTQLARVPKPTTHKPQGPAKISSFNSVDESSSGGESPMRRIPPPQPQPPFKMPAWKYVVEGDYVRIESTLSPHSGSPELDDVESLPPTANGVDDGDATSSPLFCSSPDVDSKADSFIAKFRAGLKLEKSNSFNKNQNQDLRLRS